MKGSFFDISIVIALFNIVNCKFQHINKIWDHGIGMCSKFEFVFVLCRHWSSSFESLPLE